MSGSSFVHRKIDVTFRRGKGVPFTESGTDTVTLSGLRVSATIAKAGGISQGQLDLRVYGMSESLMNDLSLVGAAPVNLDVGNVVAVAAGDDGAGMSIAYQGTISAAMADYSGAPNVAFRVLGIAALEAALMTVPPTSHRGGADVATIMGDLAKIMGMKFENAGVAGVILSNPYYSGSPYAQAEACAHDAGINMFVDSSSLEDRGTLAIWPAGGTRGGEIPLIGPKTGLVGYPTKMPIGVAFSCLYNPSVTFGAKVQLETSVKSAAGVWQVVSLDHNLESETPGGSWFSHVTAAPVGFV
jgi:hypothetical protein